MWLTITWVGVAKWKLMISSLHGPWSTCPSPPTWSHIPVPPLWVWSCSTSIQCSHAALRCINHRTTDTELCNRLAPFTIVAVAAVQTGSRESLVTMPTTPATRLLSTQTRLLPLNILCTLDLTDCVGYTHHSTTVETIAQSVSVESWLGSFQTSQLDESVIIHPVNLHRAHIK